MSKFNDILMDASENIPEQYFSTKIQKSGREKLVYRERIYCYELYHQIRNRWEPGSDIEFHAEYDKSGSSIYAGTNFQNVKPDFLIHSSGNNKRNFIAMEVKPSSASRSAINKDIDKLIGLTTNSNFNFEFGIFLIYGKDAVNKGNIASQYVSGKLNSKSKSNIKIFIHNQAGTKAFVLAPQA